MTGTSASPVTVREARPEEGPAVAALLRESYVASAAELPPDLLRGWIDDVLDPGGATTLVALAEGTLAGTARLHLAGTYPIPLRAGSVGVRAVAVAPARRRSGVARALMAACAERARTGGAAALYLHTAPLHGRCDRPLRGPGLPPRPGDGHRHRRAIRGRISWEFDHQGSPGSATTRTASLRLRDLIRRHLSGAGGPEESLLRGRTRGGELGNC
jgi:GNAT superfamily N-acetyltransferase